MTWIIAGANTCRTVVCIVHKRRMYEYTNTARRDHIGNCLLAREFHRVLRMDERNRSSNQAFWDPWFRPRGYKSSRAWSVHTLPSYGGPSHLRASFRLPRHFVLPSSDAVFASLILGSKGNVTLFSFLLFLFIFPLKIRRELSHLLNRIFLLRF